MVDSDPRLQAPALGAEDLRRIDEATVSKNVSKLADTGGAPALHPHRRATEFKQRCQGLGIKNVTLHSYRYAWAERALASGYPERYAQVSLGHSSKAIHRAYAKKAKVIIPSLESYENGDAVPSPALGKVVESARRPAPSAPF